MTFVSGYFRFISWSAVNLRNQWMLLNLFEITRWFDLNQFTSVVTCERFRSHLLNGLPMFPPSSSSGPCRSPAAGPAALLPGRCFRSGSLSSREPVVPRSFSAVSELFRFLITGEENRGLTTENRAGRRPRSCGRRGAESGLRPERVPADPPAETRREQLIRSQSQAKKTTTWSHRDASTASGERRNNDNQNKTLYRKVTIRAGARCIHVQLVRLVLNRKVLKMNSLTNL